MLSAKKKAALPSGLEDSCGFFIGARPKNLRRR